MTLWHFVKQELYLLGWLLQDIHCIRPQVKGTYHWMLLLLKWYKLWRNMKHPLELFFFFIPFTFSTFLKVVVNFGFQGAITFLGVPPTPWLWACMSVSVSEWLSVWVCVHVCVHVCMFVWVSKKVCRELLCRKFDHIEICLTCKKQDRKLPYASLKMCRK